MIRRVDLRGAADPASDIRAVVPRASVDVATAMDSAARICADVRRRGEKAVLAATRRFDSVEDPVLAVPSAAIDQAYEQLDPDVRTALAESIRRLRSTCAAERGTDVTTQVAPGGTVTRRHLPVQRVGLYVPGGLAPLVSSVVMNVVPAQVAGVVSIAVASSPQREHGGLPHPVVLAGCAALGVDEVYAVGGAQAIAMFGYGAGPCRAVDLVTGPGNVYVTAAKRLLRGQVGTDGDAGPTEILVLADNSADPVHVAADLISQSEHDPLAASVLVTPSPELVDRVQEELIRQVAAAKHAERINASLRGDQSAVVLVDDLDQGLAVVDAYAAEHLSVQTRDAADVAVRVRNAGAVFVGPYTPIALGDYCAGSNHVLPTGGSARHSSGLSVSTFLRQQHVVSYDEAALREVAAAVIALAEAEDLPAHGSAVRARC
ncbi:MAG TPA: histidinol dehydrogenase [Nocardioidaceae bacterium]|nr:histidinol dehydrogenase [Nocardioidaceae bacterium]